MSGALIGAKAAFLVADGLFYRHDWLALVSGRSVTGGLLGGYTAVEIGKKVLRYPRTTGDVFAVVVPLGLMLGRIGCLFAGCCPGVSCQVHWWSVVDDQGIARWPDASAEMFFNAWFLAWAWIAGRLNWQIGNRFHVYLLAYGLFRFGHEFLRYHHRWIGPIGGYHLLALLIAGLGAWWIVQRRRQIGDLTPRVAGG